MNFLKVSSLQNLNISLLDPGAECDAQQHKISLKSPKCVQQNICLNQNVKILQNFQNSTQDPRSPANDHKAKEDKRQLTCSDLNVHIDSSDLN